MKYKVGDRVVFVDPPGIDSKRSEQSLVGAVGVVNRVLPDQKKRQFYEVRFLTQPKDMYIASWWCTEGSIQRVRSDEL